MKNLINFALLIQTRKEMKKLIIILLMLNATILPAQDNKIDKLSDKIDKLMEQMAESSKQQAATNARFETKFEGIDKRFDSIDKRFDDANKRMDMLFYMMLAMLTGIFGLIGFVVWDRQASIKPILDENKEIVKEKNLLKEKDLKHEEKEKIADKFFKKLVEKYPDLANS